MKTKFYYLACLLLVQLTVKAQMKIGDNSTTINSASLLELETIDKGLVLPRVSLSDVSSSLPLPSGLLTSTVVYNTNSGTTGGSGIGIYYWDGTKWNFIANNSTTANYWSLTGNSGTNAATNFIGTLDATDFVARTANTERMRILGAASLTGQPGWIGMGISAPRSSLDVTGNYSNKNVITIQNTSSTGFSSVDMLDNTGALKGTFGYGNAGTGANFGSKLYFNTYGNDFLLTANSGTYHFVMKGGTGYVGINTNTPTERLHVVGNFYLAGAFMPNGLPGTSGYVLTSAGANTSPTWNNLNSLSWNLTGNSGTSYATNFLGTTDFVSMRFRTNSIQRMIIDSLGRVGIGINNPTYALSVLSQINPLYLSGVQATTTLSTDSVLTINAGIVKKTPYSALNSSFWSLTGNSGTNYATNFLGTNDNVSLRLRTNNIQRMIIDSLGSVAIGSSSFDPFNREKLLVDNGSTTSDNIATFRGSRDGFEQIEVQNTNSGSNASSDFVATSDDGTDSTYYIDMGINSSGYAPNVDNFGGQHDGYLYTYSRNLLIGTAKANSDLIFLLGGGQTKFNAVMRMDGATGNIIIGKGENQTNATGNIIRGPNGGNGTNIPGGSLTLQGGASNGNTTGGSLYLYGGSTVSGTYGSININTSTNSATNINTGTSTGTVTIGNSLNNINLPKLSAASVVLTDAGQNLTSTTPSNNTYLYYNGTNFTWATAASSLASLTNGAGIASLNYNGSSAATVSLANGTAAGQVYVTGALPFTPSLVTLSGDATISSAGALSLATVNSNVGTFNNVTVNAKGLVTAASNVAYSTLGSFSATAPLTYNNVTGVFAINQATTLANGYLSSADWNTFNNKVGSITLNTPSSVFGNPINFSVSSGAATGTLSLNTQTVNTVFAGPAAGTAATPTFRTLVAADIPSLAGSYIQNQSTQQAASNFNISGNGTIGTNLAVTGTSTLTGTVISNGGLTNTGILTSSGGAANINGSSNFATNINTGTSTGTVTLGNALNNINLPKLSATSVVLTDASKNLTSTTPSNNTYLYYNGTNFTWATAASSLASLTDGTGIASLNYNGSAAATVSLADGTAAGQVYVTGASPFTPSLVTLSGDATISSAGALSLATVNSNVGTFNNVTINAKGLVTAASNVAYSTLGSFSATAPLTYNNATGVFAINQATTLASGYLSSADWNTFNNKVGSITLNTPSSVFSNPINFSVSSGAATGTLSLNAQAAGTVFAGPVNAASGTSPAVPTFRALVAADIPSLAGSYIQNQSTLQTSSNFNISGNGTIGTNLTVTGKSTLTGVTNTGTLTTSGGDVNMNINSNNGTNINTGTSTSNVTIGNSANNILLPKFNITGGMIYSAAGTGQIASTGSSMTWDAINNRLGIGISSPAYKLSVLSASNPLYLSGVQATAAFTTDSVLTIFNGVVKKASYSSLSGAGNWSLTGNGGTTPGTNFIGTTDAVDFVTKTNGTERMRVTSAGLVGIGTSAPASDLTIYQSSGSGGSKGFTFTGNSISGTNSGTGFLMSLGYNTPGNKQLWLGDGDYAGNIAGSFARFVTTGTVFPVFDAVSGDGSLRRYLAFGVAGDANSGVIFGGDNTAVNPGSQVWDNGNMTIGGGYKSNAAPSNGLLVQGNVGIGTASPPSALSVLAASNPLYLSGVQATAAFTTDSVLTIFNGTVKKAPYSSLPSANAWQLTGNQVSAGNFLGTLNALPLILKANSVQMGYFDGNVSSLALGVGAINNSSDHNVAIGYNASTSNQYALALGYNATATGVRSVAIGNGISATTASGSESIAIGYNSTSSNTQSTAIGYQAQATGAYGVALGYSAQATALQSTAIGYSSLASAQYTNAIGYQAQATGLQSTAIGYHAQTAQTNTILLGDVSTPNLYVGIGTATPSAKLDILASAGNNPLEITGLPTGTVGTDNILTINSSGVVGSVTASNFSGNYWSLNGNAAASGSFLGTTNTTPLLFKYNSISAGIIDANNNTAFGTSYTIAGSTNTAIGYSSNASNSATAVGASSIANAVNNTALGNNATANLSSQETALGSSATAGAQYNTAVGYNAQAVSNSQATAIGTSSLANAFQSTSLGYGAQAISNAQTTALGVSALSNAQYNTAVGYNAQAISNSQATALGTSSKANAQYNTAVGYNAQAITNSQATAIGTNSSASGNNSTAIGYGATTSQTNAIVLGTSTNNVGIGTSTPNTNTKLDVAGSFKLGTAGSVLSSMIKSSVTISPTVNLGTTTTYTATVTGAATGASVIVNPRSVLASGVVLAYSYVSSANTITIAFTSGSTTGALGSLTFDVTVIQ